ncbi:hypothetical protein [Rubrobacter calidifluminis]|uniref:hypothetical protein n=1 Tax=Rubrobacter calidifluminis TaxID=1392640 RepID=UPI00235F79AB|nr:hypothetical protein [Rubrobacter calidifluminis]
MSPPQDSSPHQRRRDPPLRRAARLLVCAVTLAFLLCSLLTSCTLLVFSARSHELKSGLFALLFCTLSAHLTLSWLSWLKGNTWLAPFGEQDL